MDANNITEARASHACLVTSQDEALRERAILELARSLLCEGGGKEPCGVCRSCKLALSGIHPDIIFIDRPLDDKGKPKREIPVSSIRAMAADAWVLPQEAESKVFVIREANRMNTIAQNAALKILEEPPAFSRFILGAGSAEELLPTVRSRCTVLALAGERPRVENAQAGEYLALVGSGDVPGLCRFFAECESLDSAELSDMLTAVRQLLGAYLAGSGVGFELTRRDAVRLLELCRRAEEYLRLNVSVKHVLGMLCVLSESGAADNE